MQQSKNQAIALFDFGSCFSYALTLLVRKGIEQIPPLETVFGGFAFSKCTCDASNPAYWLNNSDNAEDCS